MADDEPFRLAARRLFQLRPYTMILSDQTRGVSEVKKQWEDLAAYMETDPGAQGNREVFQRFKEQFWDEVDQAPALRPYQVFGVGNGLDAEGCYLAIVLAHADEASARENEERLRQRIEETSNLSHFHSGGSSPGPAPWREFFGETDIHVEGRTLLAQLRLNREGQGLMGCLVTFLPPTGSVSYPGVAAFEYVERAGLAVFQRDPHPLLLHE